METKIDDSCDAPAPLVAESLSAAALALGATDGTLVTSTGETVTAPRRGG
jgi:hypothetical protein